jgi:hypothetical protein
MDRMERVAKDGECFDEVCALSGPMRDLAVAFKTHSHMKADQRVMGYAHS